MPTAKLRGTGVAWRSVDGVYLGLDLRRGEYFCLNESATVLWPALVVGATADQLSTRLVEAFAIPARVAAADVAVLLAELRSRDLLEC